MFAKFYIWSKVLNSAVDFEDSTLLTYKQDSKLQYIYIGSFVLGYLV